MPPADILASIILLILTSLPSSTPIHQTILPAQASQVKKFKGHSIPMSLVNSRASSVSSGKLPPSTRKRRYSYVGSDMPPPTNHAFPQPAQKRISIPPSTRTGTPSSVFNSTCDTETEAQASVREDDDALNEVIMAVNIKDRNTVGCAYYVAREEKLCLSQDIKMGGLDVIEMRESARHIPMLCLTREFNGQ